MLSVRDLNISYGENRPALIDFHLHMGKGEIVALVGESGSGKSTAIRAIMGLLPPGGKMVSGDIVLEGSSLLPLTPGQWQRLRGTRLSIVFQDSGAMLNPIRTIGGQFLEYVLSHSSLSGKEARALIMDMLRRMGLPHVESIVKSYPFQLSGGMRQRVGIALAMIFQPGLLLADEPTSALDVTTQAQIVRQLMELRDVYQTSILMVTHNLGVAAYMADQILVMQHGRVVERGTRREILGRRGDRYTRELLDAVPDMRGRRYA